MAACRIEGCITKFATFEVVDSKIVLVMAKFGSVQSVSKPNSLSKSFLRATTRCTSVFGYTIRIRNAAEQTSQTAERRVRPFAEPEPELGVQFSPVRVRTDFPNRTLPTLDSAGCAFFGESESTPTTGRSSLFQEFMLSLSVFTFPVRARALPTPFTTPPPGNKWLLRRSVALCLERRHRWRVCPARGCGARPIDWRILKTEDELTHLTMGPTIEDTQSPPQVGQSPHLRRRYRVLVPRIQPDASFVPVPHPTVQELQSLGGATDFEVTHGSAAIWMTHPANPPTHQLTPAALASSPTSIRFVPAPHSRPPPRYAYHTTRRACSSLPECVLAADATEGVSVSAATSRSRAAALRHGSVLSATSMSTTRPSARGTGRREREAEGGGVAGECERGGQGEAKERRERMHGKETRLRGEMSAARERFMAILLPPFPVRAASGAAPRASPPSFHKATPRPLVSLRSSFFDALLFTTFESAACLGSHLIPVRPRLDRTSSIFPVVVPSPSALPSIFPTSAARPPHFLFGKIPFRREELELRAGHVHESGCTDAAHGRCGCGYEPHSVVSLGDAGTMRGRGRSCGGKTIASLVPSVPVTGGEEDGGHEAAILCRHFGIRWSFAVARAGGATWKERREASFEAGDLAAPSPSGGAQALVANDDGQYKELVPEAEAEVPGERDETRLRRTAHHAIPHELRSASLFFSREYLRVLIVTGVSILFLAVAATLHESVTVKIVTADQVSSLLTPGSANFRACRSATRNQIFQIV
ncbi:hypothetical protein C8R45DRAFT_944830 [Mycena sanguinolenta]|nr:hypothetical protein C8R45DRAFT_944830 [Mycena sanguinolenta]